jgi:hypothetical protein
MCSHRCIEAAGAVPSPMRTECGDGRVMSGGTGLGLLRCTGLKCESRRTVAASANDELAIAISAAVLCVSVSSVHSPPCSAHHTAIYPIAINQRTTIIHQTMATVHQQQAPCQRPAG